MFSLLIWQRSFPYYFLRHFSICRIYIFYFTILDSLFHQFYRSLILIRGNLQRHRKTVSIHVSVSCFVKACIHSTSSCWIILSLNPCNYRLRTVYFFRCNSICTVFDVVIAYYSWVFPDKEAFDIINQIITTFCSPSMSCLWNSKLGFNKISADCIFFRSLIQSVKSAVRIKISFKWNLSLFWQIHRILPGIEFILFPFFICNYKEKIIIFIRPDLQHFTVNQSICDFWIKPPRLCRIITYSQFFCSAPGFNISKVLFYKLINRFPSHYRRLWAFVRRWRYHHKNLIFPICISKVFYIALIFRDNYILILFPDNNGSDKTVQASPECIQSWLRIFMRVDFHCFKNRYQILSNCNSCNVNIFSEGFFTFDIQSFDKRDRQKCHLFCCNLVLLRPFGKQIP